MCRIVMPENPWNWFGYIYMIILYPKNTSFNILIFWCCCFLFCCILLHACNYIYAMHDGLLVCCVDLDANNIFLYFIIAISCLLYLIFFSSSASYYFNVTQNDWNWFTIRFVVALPGVKLNQHFVYDVMCCV